MRELTVKHLGYTARLYGTSSMSICDGTGKEILHTSSRDCNTEEEVMKVLEIFDETMESLMKM
jgi:hypothetical protein